jgi:hypothetical protein
MPPRIILRIFLWFLLSLMLGFLLERWRLKRVRKAFIHPRQAMSDTEFLLRADASVDEAAPFLTARRAIAGLCGVSADMLHPDDAMQSLFRLQHDGGDFLNCLFTIERQWGVMLRRSRFLEKPSAFPESPTLRDFLKVLYRDRRVDDRTVRNESTNACS